VFFGVSKSVAKRWGENRERHLLQHGLTEEKQVPTLKEFEERFLHSPHGPTVKSQAA